MEKKDAVVFLKESICRLEQRQAEEGRMLKEQFRLTYESLNPLSLLRDSVEELSSGSAPEKKDLLEYVMALVPAYLTQRILVHSGRNPVKKALAAVVQYSVTKLVAANLDAIRKALILSLEHVIRFFEGRTVRRNSSSF